MFYTEAVLRLVEEKEVVLEASSSSNNSSQLSSSSSSQLSQLETIRSGDYARFIHCLSPDANLRYPTLAEFSGLRIHIIFGSWIRIRIRVNSWIRIRIRVKSLIRISIKVKILML